MFTGRKSDNSTKLSSRAKEVRQETQELFQNLVTLINAYAIVYGAEKYKPLTSKINEAVEYARTHSARRGARKKEGRRSESTERNMIV